MNSTSNTGRASPRSKMLGLYGTGSSTTRAEGQVDQLFVTRATPSFFTTLGAQPQRGRLPTDNDDDTVSSSSAIGCGGRWFGSDAKVIDKSYHLRERDAHRHRRHETGVPLP